MTNEANDSKWGYGPDNSPSIPKPGVPKNRGQASRGFVARLDTGQWTPAEPNVKTDTMQLSRIDTGPRPHDAAGGALSMVGGGESSSVSAFGDGHSIEGDSSLTKTGTDAEEFEHLDDNLDRSDSTRNMIEWAVVLVASVLIALLIRSFLVQAFWIPSSSMETTLMIKDRVLVNKIGHRIGDSDRGDIVVFHKTDAEIQERPDEPKDVIKRVVATAGETVLIKDNQVFIDDKLLLEPYLDEGVSTTDFGPFVVPEDHVFVMGDNREGSRDSRFGLGPVAEDRIVGRAFFTFWPVDRIGGL